MHSSQENIISTRKKRGVSPIVSSMMLIVIIIAAFSLLYAATDQWIRTQRREPMMAMQERFVIEDIWFRTDGGTKIATIYVRNGGEVDVTIMYSTANDVSYIISPSEVEIAPGAGGELNITIPWVTDTTYEVTVKTERGSTTTSYETA